MMKTKRTRETSANRKFKVPHTAPRQGGDQLPDQPSKQEGLDTTGDADSQPEMADMLEDVALKEK
jgi:hypothetical protein